MTKRSLVDGSSSPHGVVDEPPGYLIDPLSDARWQDLVSRHLRATVFHTAAWLRALKKTYGYEPVAFTRCPPAARLEQAIVFCQVRSWLTGDRLVSLPFSDHCDPLTATIEDFDVIVRHVKNRREGCGWRYIELRPQSDESSGTLGLSGRSDGAKGEFGVCDRFWLHRLDLRRGEQVLFRSFSKDSIQRKIRRAAREGLSYEEGRSSGSSSPLSISCW